MALYLSVLVTGSPAVAQDDGAQDSPQDAAPAATEPAAAGTTEDAPDSREDNSDAAAGDDPNRPAPQGTVVSRELTVQEGETLTSIARRELGRVGLMPLLADFNGLDQATVLTPGQVIQIPFFAIARVQSATVLFTKGVVLRDDEPLVRGDEVYIDDTLSTGEDGFLSLEFVTGSVVNLQPNTRATLTQLSCLPDDDTCAVQLETEGGVFSSEVERSVDQPAEFRILTPYASAAVRGTVFDFDAGVGELRVAVVEGQVDLTALDVTVPLDTGFGAVTVEGEPPGEPEALPPAPRFRYIPNRVTTADTLRWWELPEVQQYQAQLSEDEDGTRVLATFDVQGNGLSIDEQPPGDYHIILRGLNASLLPGFSSSSRLTVARIDSTLEPLATSIERDGSAFLVAVIDPPEDTPGFEIQVSTDEAFTTPISVDVGGVGSAIIRIDSDVLYARARQLIDPLTVSPYGEVSQIQ